MAYCNMKTTFIYSCIFFLLFIKTVSSQIFKGGPIIGFNATQVDGDERIGFKRFGLHAGATVMVPLKNNFSVGMEVLYSEKGSYEKPHAVYFDSLNGAYNLIMNYVEIPLMVYYKDKDFITFGTGFSYNYLFKYTETAHGRRISNWNNDLPEPNKNDITWIAHVDVPLTKKIPNLKLNFRYCYSVKSFRTVTFKGLQGDPWRRKQFHNILTLRLMYIFAEGKQKNTIYK